MNGLMAGLMVGAGLYLVFQQLWPAAPALSDRPDPGPAFMARLSRRLGLEPGQARRLGLWAFPGAAAGGVVAWVVWNGWPVLVLAGLVAGAVAPIWYRLGRLGKRTLEFREDLAAAVDLLQAQLFTGQGLVGALRALGEQGPARLQGEFRLLYQDVSLHGLEPAFRRAQARLEDAQFDLVAEALITADRAGGGAGKVLETLASSIRANLHLTRQIRAEQTRHIFSARVGAVWPLVILTFLKLSGSDYVAVFDTLPGQAALLLSLSLMLAGYLVMRVMGRIRPERRNF